MRYLLSVSVLGLLWAAGCGWETSVRPEGAQVEADGVGSLATEPWQQQMQQAGPAYSLERVGPGALGAVHPVLDLRAAFGVDGLQVRGRHPGPVSWSIAARRLNGISLEPVEPRALGNRAFYERSSLREWYVHGPAGLEQGFDLPTAPAGWHGGDVVVELAVEASVAPEQLGDATLVWSWAPGIRLYYGLAMARDAGGAALPVRIEHEPGLIRLAVSGAGVPSFPLVIDPLIWVESTLVPSDPTDPPAAGDRFGFAVALYGQVGLVGVPYNDVDATDSGSVYLFGKDLTGAWLQRRKVNAAAPRAGARFGWSVALSGGAALVGAPYDSSQGSEAGAAHILEPDTINPLQWEDKAKLLPAAGASTHYGIAVALDIDLAAVGSTVGKVSIRGRAQGAAPGWGQVKELTGTAAAGFGEVLALYDDVLVIGLPRDDTQATDAGAVQVVLRNQGGVDNWGTLTTLYSPDPGAGDAFGSAVSLEGDSLLVGAVGDDQGGTDAGAAYLFSRNLGGINAWGLVKKLRAGDAAAGQGLGSGVSVAGHSAAVAGAAARRVYLFERDTGGADVWGEVGTLSRTNPATGDRFANAVSLSEDRVLVGEGETQAGPNQGAAYLFELVYLGQPCTWDTDCRSGHCIDSVCCNAACDAACDGCVAVKTGLAEDGLCGTVLDSVACDDGDLCTQTSTCDQGNCIGDNPITCTALDQCHDAGVCNPADGRCSNPNTQDNTTCDDGNGCTRTDRCVAGACVGTQPIVCTPLDVCHMAGLCDPATGLCSDPPKPDDSPCSDQNACTRVDRCAGGLCRGADAIVCLPLDQCHVAGSCNPATGQCTNPNKAEAAPCDDGLYCTIGDNCQNGQCRGSMRTCVVGVSCQAGACDEGNDNCSGSPLPDAGGCDDGDRCTHGDSCTGGVCAGTAYTCSDGLSCTDDLCLGDGGCDHPLRAGGCDDGDPCTHTDQCTGTVCAGSAYSCDDGNSCTADTCLGNGTCGRVQLAGTCDDGNACTQIDVCAEGRCVGQSPVVCTAQSQCHGVGVCDLASGLCSNPPRPPGTPCDDGLYCTVQDQCSGGACAGTARACAAGVSCRDGSCDEGNDRCSGIMLQDGWSCDDGDPCSVGDLCAGGECEGTPYGCDDGSVCTEDVCDGNGGCLRRAENGLCDDGLACTWADTCRFGACTGTPHACNDGNSCTTDSCNGDGTCAFTPNTVSCDDGDPCTVGDQCGGGACLSGIYACDDSGQLIDGGGEDGGPAEDGGRTFHKPGGCGCGASSPSWLALAACLAFSAAWRRRAVGRPGPARA